MGRVMGYRITSSVGMAGKVRPDDTIEDYEQPKFGRYWWYWLPSFNSNHGKFSRFECVDVGVLWLCFWLDFTFWPIRQKGVIFGFSAKDKAPKGSTHNPTH